ncbi:MAG: hypothetical protein R3A51_11170 [Nannocystaceae bacterium]|nr:hypothetical protein [Myxococcales bacterium]
MRANNSLCIELAASIHKGKLKISSPDVRFSRALRSGSRELADWVVELPERVREVYFVVKVPKQLGSQLRIVSGTNERAGQWLRDADTLRSPRLRKGETLRYHIVHSELESLHVPSVNRQSGRIMLKASA